MTTYKKHAGEPKRNVRETVKMYKSSGNVFKDIGFDDEESCNLLVRSRLMIEIERIIKASGWTQIEAAEVLGVVQPRISELLSGRIDRFSVDMLLKFLSRLGKKVTFKIVDNNVA